jgi:hypothetical protein
LNNITITKKEKKEEIINLKLDPFARRPTFSMGASLVTSPTSITPKKENQKIEMSPSNSHNLYNFDLDDEIESNDNKKKGKI